MIETKESLIGNIENKNSINGIVNKEIEVIQPLLQEKTVTPTENLQEIEPDENYNGLSKVNVNKIPNEYIIPSGTLNISGAGEYDVKNYATVISTGADLNEYFETNITSYAYNSYKGGLQVVKKTPVINIADSVTTLNAACYDYWKIAVNPPTLSGGKNVTNMENLFGITNTAVGSYIQNSTADVHLLDTRNVTTMKYMFGNNTKTTTITGLSNFNCNSLETAEGMFWACHMLTSIDFGNNTFPVLNTTKNMFYGCKALTHLDIRGMNLTILDSYNLMFGDSSANGAIPADCEIIVADQTQKDWVTSHFSRLTNVKTVAEYEGG